MKHGLAGHGVCLPEDLEAERQAKLAAYIAELQPTDEVERDLVEQMATAAVRPKHCVEREGALILRISARAQLAWEEDRRAEVEERAARLARDP
ncbi:MAG: hypothetical protein IRY99_02950 [Isosphaeraceae bacterium]|nr:hypothetical protein [Isosphaeraceae bacterium]